TVPTQTLNCGIVLNAAALINDDEVACSETIGRGHQVSVRLVPNVVRVQMKCGAAEVVIRIGKYENARGRRGQHFACFLDEREQRPIIRRKMLLAPIFATIAKRRSVCFSSKIDRPSDVENEPSDGEKSGDRNRKRRCHY